MKVVADSIENVKLRHAVGRWAPSLEDRGCKHLLVSLKKVPQSRLKVIMVGQLLRKKNATVVYALIPKTR